MPSPVVPGDIKALIPDPSNPLCGNFIGSLLKLPALLWKWFAWAFDSSGNPTKAFVNSTQRTGSLIFSDGTILLCDGRDVSQTTYADLYAKIGATFGASTAGNFKLPDWRAKYVAGIGTFTHSGSLALGVTKGADQMTLAKANLPAHDHSDGTHTYLLKPPYAGSVTGSDTVNSGSEQAVGPSDGAAIQSVGSGTAFDLLPPTLGAYVYIVC